MFGIVKGLFGFCKVRYRGLKKNLAKLRMLFASANLLKYAWPDVRTGNRLSEEGRGVSAYPECGRRRTGSCPLVSITGKNPDNYRPLVKTFVPGSISVFESR
jgi:hypothetical protein